MVKLLLIALVFVGTCSSYPTNGKDDTFVPGQNELHYIGSLSVVDGKTIEEHKIYVSENAASWTRAQQDCKVRFPKKGSLIGIDTPAELDQLAELLTLFGTSSIYWTGGQYARGGWLWSGNGQLVKPFATPTTVAATSPGVQSRLGLNYMSQFEYEFDSIQDSTPQRYICRVK